MTENAILNVYQYFNPTDLKLKKDDRDDGITGGLAFSRNGEDKKILVPIEGNKTNKYADHSNEIKSFFAHEKKHYEDYTNWGPEIYSLQLQVVKEQRAITAQFQDKTWQNVRPEFRDAVTKYGIQNQMPLFPPTGPVKVFIMLRL